MSLPDLGQYQAAVQAPSISFADPRLKSARVVTDRFGIPLAASGGFAVAFQLERENGRWAVRCFSRPIDGLDMRYAQISSYLAARSSPYLLRTDFLGEGIRVSGQWWPVTVMPWVQGDALNDWIGRVVTDARRVAALRERLVELVDDLEAAGIAHGDLQHGNIIVTEGDRPVLIDYDGMFVPALAGRTMPEAGHPNYQHPDRAALPFGPELDRFSAIVIWSGLRALELKPQLWPQFDTGENILFGSKDFADPTTSRLLAALRSDPLTVEIADNITRVIRAPGRDTPRLKDFLAGRLPEARPTVATPHVSVAAYPIVDLRLEDPLPIGRRAIVVGEVIGRYVGRTARGDMYTFLDLGSRQRTSLKLVLWSETLMALAARRDQLQVGRVIAVTGIISTYDGRPQLELERSSLLELPNATRVRELIGSAWTDAAAKPVVATDLGVGDVVSHRRFGQGVVSNIVGDIAFIRFGSQVYRIAYHQYPMTVVRRGPRPGPSSPTPAAASSTATTRPSSSQGATSGRPTATGQAPSAGAGTYQDDLGGWNDLIQGTVAATGRTQLKGSAGQPASAAATSAASSGQAATGATAKVSAPRSAPGAAGTRTPSSTPSPQTTSSDFEWNPVLVAVLAMAALIVVSLLVGPR